MKEMSLLQDPDAVEITGTIERVVFHNEENGYTVLRLKNAASSSEQQRLSAGPVVLTPHNRQALVEGEVVPLTATEFGILHDLLRHKGIVRSREQIMLQVWGDDFEGYTRTVDVHVKKLRAKLGRGACILETIRGFGYMAKDDANA